MQGGVKEWDEGKPAVMVEESCWRAVSLRDISRSSRKEIKETGEGYTACRRAWAHSARLIGSNRVVSGSCGAHPCSGREGGGRRVAGQCVRTTMPLPSVVLEDEGE